MSSEAVLKAWAACNLTDTLFVLVCTVFCWPIIPAVGLAYSGYSHRRNGMASFMPGILSIGICSIQWFIIGYSLAYGEGSGVIGDFKYAFHRGVLADPVGTIPAILFSEFQLVFEATVCAIAVGGFCERGRTLPIIPFIFVSPVTIPKLDDKTSITQISGTIQDRFNTKSLSKHWPVLLNHTKARYQSSISRSISEKKFSASKRSSN